VWVSLLSVFVLHEHMSPMRISGIALIIMGVIAIGREAR
jgi:multidrug transporter EmrE-like cation transporter